MRVDMKDASVEHKKTKQAKFVTAVFVIASMFVLATLVAFAVWRSTACGLFNQSEIMC